MKARVLLIDDEDLFREDLAELLRTEGYDCQTANDGEVGLRRLQEDRPDLVLSDLVMPGLGGVELVGRIAALSPDLPVILMTAHGTLETAIEAFRKGAVDYLLKPLVLQDLLNKIGRALELRNLQRELRYRRREISEATTGTTIIGHSRAIEKVRELILKVAGVDSSILITGASGTGKELVARAIHEAGEGDERPMVTLNCAAIPRELAESELFGHVRGAFTGATRDKPGAFELAREGTLFLDEVGELPLELQPKLLRAVEEQQITRVGGTRPISTPLRIVAATNRDLMQEIEEGRFREDLYYRIRVVEIPLPSLRDRREDIPLLVEHLLRRLNARLKRQVQGVDPAALQVLMSASWRGNVRELLNVLERAVLLTDHERLGLDDLPNELTGAADSPKVSDDLRSAVRAYERHHILQVLRATDGNREEAARRLGINPSTLYRRFKQLGI